MHKGQKLRIALVFDDSLDSDDGVAQYVKVLGGWLTAHGNEVTYLVGQTKITHWKGGQVRSLSKNINIRFNGNKLSMPLPTSRRAIKSSVMKWNYDVMHVMVPYSPLLAAKIIKTADETTAVIGTFHIFPANKLSIYGSKLLRILLNDSLYRFDEFISVSRAAQDFSKSVFGITSKVIPNAIITHDFINSSPSENRKRKKIVFLGRIVKRKGVNHLIKAFELFCVNETTTDLLIAGDGPDRAKLEKMVQRLGLSHRIKFLGYIAQEKKAALLASADIACFPSVNGESFGIVLIEAMAAGAKVVLAGDNPGYRTIMESHPLLLIDPRQTQLFAERLHTLLYNNQLISRINKWQNHNVLQYDIENVAPQIVEIYNRQIARLAKKGNN